jgi:hypothetical protein
VPFLLAGLGVAGDQRAAEEGPVDAPVVVNRRGDEARLAVVALAQLQFPQHLAVLQPHRFAVAVLVDQVGDPVGDRRRELDQPVRADVPSFLQRRVEHPLVCGQVMRPLRNAPEQRPGDIARRLAGRFALFAFPAAAGGEQQRERRGEHHQCRPRLQHVPIIGSFDWGKERRTRIELA